MASFGAAPTGGLLTISSDNTGVAVDDAGNHVIATLPVGAQPLVIPYLHGIRGFRGGTLTASLSDGGVAIVGGVFIIATFEGA